MDLAIAWYPLRAVPAQAGEGPGRMLWGPGEGQKLELTRKRWSASDRSDPVHALSIPAVQGFFP